MALGRRPTIGMRGERQRRVRLCTATAAATAAATATAISAIPTTTADTAATTKIAWVVKAAHSQYSHGSCSREERGFRKQEIVL